MERPPKKISVVVEAAANDNDENDITVIRCLDSLMQQTHPNDQLEFLVCCFGWDDRKKREVQERFPAVLLIDSPDEGYYRTKNLGILSATGEIVALADADCLYSPNWASSIAHTLENGADVSVGFTVMSGNGLFRRLCGFYDLHSMLLRLHGKVRRFNSNNVAFRADIIQARGYDERFNRTGGCVQLAEQLLRDGVKMEFNVTQFAVHRFYGFQRHTWIQALCNGYDVFHTREVDPTMPLAMAVRLRWFAPPILAAVFFVADLYNIVQNRSILSIRWHEFPAFIFFSLTVRCLEIIGMYWTLMHRRTIASFVERNFA